MTHLLEQWMWRTDCKMNNNKYGRYITVYKRPLHSYLVCFEVTGSVPAEVDSHSLQSALQMDPTLVSDWTSCTASGWPCSLFWEVPVSLAIVLSDHLPYSFLNGSGRPGLIYQQARVTTYMLCPWMSVVLVEKKRPSSEYIFHLSGTITVLFCFGGWILFLRLEHGNSKP